MFLGRRLCGSGFTLDLGLLNGVWGWPVVTWPQSRVVSRQTYAFLNQIGLPELAAKDGDDYVQIAAELAGDPVRLALLRGSMRERMLGSALMDVAGFTRQLEDALIQLFDAAGQNDGAASNPSPP